MNTISITDRTEWENFIDEHAITTFMQSWYWGEFEEGCTHRVFRCALKDGDTVVAVVQSVLIRSKRGTFLYVPHGPIIRKDLLPWSAWTPGSPLPESTGYAKIEEIIDHIHHELLQLAQAENCTFIRVNSSLPNQDPFRQMFERKGYKIAPIYLTSENAAVLPLLGQTPDTILSAMRKTTRYLIHKAEKEQVTVSVDTSGESIDEFMKLYTLTTEREKFVGFGDEYIKREFEAFGRYGNAVLLHAYHKAQNLATALILFTNNSAFYHQGASNHPKVPAPYLLQYHAMEIARQRGCKFYNLWGTYIPHRTPRGWQGLTLFKTGFTKMIWSYLPTMDLPMSPLYRLTRAYEYLVRFSRGV